jgi:dipeptidyl aminopeptidase/acylaminoacyl peptidase
LLALALSIYGQIEKINLFSEGVQLNASFYRGNGMGEKPTLLWLHGNPGSKETGATRWAQELNKVGINVLIFNYRGLWGNEGLFSLGNATEDLSNAMDLLTSESFQEQYSIDTSRIYVGGNSFGSSAALIGALHDTRITKVIAIALCDHSYFGREFMNPHSQIRSFLEEAIDGLFLPNGLLNQDGQIFIDDLINHNYKYDFVAQADKLQNKELYLFVGVDDQVCPVEDHFFPLYRSLRSMDHKNVEVMVEQCDHGLKGDPSFTISEIITKIINQ